MVNSFLNGNPTHSSPIRNKNPIKYTPNIIKNINNSLLGCIIFNMFPIKIHKIISKNLIANIIKNIEKESYGSKLVGIIGNAKQLINIMNK